MIVARVRSPAAGKIILLAAELLTRARLAGDIEMEAIADETRPVVNWQVHQDSRGFIRGHFDGFLKGYWRNLMQSQPNHVEILGEKNTPHAGRLRTVPGLGGGGELRYSSVLISSS